MDPQTVSETGSHKEPEMTPQFESPQRGRQIERKVGSPRRTKGGLKEALKTTIVTATILASPSSTTCLLFRASHLTSLQINVLLVLLSQILVLVVVPDGFTLMIGAKVLLIVEINGRYYY